MTLTLPRLGLAPLALLLLLAACNEPDNQAEQTAENLEAAAEQSDPAAAESLEDAADSVRENGSVGNLSQPGSTAQDALSNAADASSNQQP